MNKSLLLTLAASAAAIMAVPAQAADFVVTPVVGPGGAYTINFDFTPGFVGTRTDRFFFTPPSSSPVSISLNTTGAGANNINFLSGFFNVATQPLTFFSPNGGLTEFLYSPTDYPVIFPDAGLPSNFVSVRYRSFGTTATFNGVIASTTSVPESATWAMMIVGVGLIGAAVRARKSQPKYNMALSYS